MTDLNTNTITVVITTPEGSFPVGANAENNYQVLITKAGQFTVRDSNNHKRITGSREGAKIEMI